MRPGGPPGRAQRRGSAGEEPAARPRVPAARRDGGGGRRPGAGRRRRVGRPACDPRSGGRCPPRCPTNSASFTTCGRPPGRPACSEGVEEEGASRPRGGGAGRPRGGGDPRVRLGRAEGPGGRWPAAAGGGGVEAPRPVGGGRREPGAGRGSGGAPERTHLRGTTRRAREATGGAFGPLRPAFGRVHRAARVLGRGGVGGSAVRNRWGGRLGARWRHRELVGERGGAVDHSVTVGRSYGSGRFHCDHTAGLPRPNARPGAGVRPPPVPRAAGDRAEGASRKGASPALVLGGSARRGAGLGTRAGAGSAAAPAEADREEWERVRAELEERRQRRVERRRFRRDPERDLKDRESRLHQSRLPAGAQHLQGL